MIIGIIKNATKAKEKTEIENEKEIIQRATVNAMGKNKYGDLKQDELQKQLDKEAEAIDVGNEFEILFKGSNRYYAVDKDGIISKPQIIIDDKNPGDITKDREGNELKGTAQEPYEIWCVEDLIEWSNNYTKYMNNYIILCRNLNFKSKYSYQDSQRTDYGNLNGIEDDGNILMNELITGSGFNPIYKFIGTFDGKGFTIKNLYIVSDNDAGFIVYGEGVLKNISIMGEISSKKNAGVVTYLRNGVLERITNYANINATTVAGLVGDGSGEINKCSNYGNITAEAAVRRNMWR